MNNAQTLEIDKEAQLLLLKGERNLRCKTFQSRLNSYDELDIDKKIAILDGKQIVGITTFQYIRKVGTEDAFIVNQIWYYE